MVNPNKLKVVKENVTVYPNVPHVKCNILNNDNSVSEVTIEKNEVELALYLKQLSKKLTTTEMNKLTLLIEIYGDARSENGAFNATYEG